MLPTEDLFVYVYVLVDDALMAGAIAVPPRPGPAPACSDAELLTIALVRHLLGRRSEAGFLDEVARDWGHLFPRLPHQSEANRRIRWLWGAFEQLRITLAARLPKDDCQQVDTSALPVKHPSRVRGPDSWTGPGNDLAARFGRDAAHAEWFYGFRLAAKTDLGSRIVRAWAIVPAAVNEREAAEDLLDAGPRPRDLLADKGFSGKAFAAAQAAHGTAVLVPPGKAACQHAAGPAESHRRMAQPDRDHLQRDHRPHGTRPPRRAHLLGPAHQDRSNHRRPHPAARLPHRGIGQPT
jgi:Transposase DDE domain